jgi:K+-transporting ATPase ATPase C chain
MKDALEEARRTALAVLALAVILCGLYTLVVWGTGQLLFPARANGSLVSSGGRVAGSRLLGQNFTAARYFHPRPSAAGAGYDAMSSGGSNLGPTSKAFIDLVRQRVEAYRAENGLAVGAAVPADAVTASGSGLDPHISLRNALLQAPRVANLRGLEIERVRRFIERFTEGRSLGLLGEPGVNVLLLNLALDGVEDGGR